MKLTAMEIEQLEDVRVLCLAKAQGLYGIETAKKYCLLLAEKARIALITGYTDEAIWFAEREFEFTARLFGLSHPYTVISKFTLDKFQDHKHIALQAAEIEMAMAS